MIEQIIQGNVLRAQEGDENAARALEEHIEQQGLWKEYVTELVGQTTDSTVVVMEWAMWALIRATPEQRARAFLEAIKDVRQTPHR